MTHTEIADGADGDAQVSDLNIKGGESPQHQVGGYLIRTRHELQGRA
jgi:hypothetical protein